MFLAHYGVLPQVTDLTVTPTPPVPIPRTLADQNPTKWGQEVPAYD